MNEGEETLKLLNIANENEILEILDFFRTGFVKLKKELLEEET